jgi:CDP-diacylglycerol---glycerol-3-phosphate 3-phosphatidyltransferase
MDPVADKLLVIAALVSLVSLDRLAGWVAMVIIARELAVTVARAQAPEVIPAAQLGKVKTVLQVAAIFFVILFDPTPMWVDALVYAAVAATVLSGVTFFLDLGRRQRAPLGEERGL